MIPPPPFIWTCAIVAEWEIVLLLYSSQPNCTAHITGERTLSMGNYKSRPSQTCTGNVQFMIVGEYFNVVCMHSWRAGIELKKGNPGGGGVALFHTHWWVVQALFKLFVTDHYIHCSSAQYSAVCRCLALFPPPHKFKAKMRHISAYEQWKWFDSIVMCNSDDGAAKMSGRRRWASRTLRSWRRWRTTSSSKTVSSRISNLLSGDFIHYPCVPQCNPHSTRLLFVRPVSSSVCLLSCVGWCWFSVAAAPMRLFRRWMWATEQRRGCRCCISAACVEVCMTTGGYL